MVFGKPSKLVHLLYISLKCINLAIILLEYLLFDPRAKRGPKLSKKFQGLHEPPCSLLPAPKGSVRA